MDAHMMRAGKILSLVAVCLGGAVLTGCVMAEKYDAEKARGLNFQRLLAQEEKRTAELDTELKKFRRELTDMENRNRDLESELQMVREQLARTQEDAIALKEAGVLGGDATTDLGTVDDDFLAGFGLDEPAVSAESAMPIYHEVSPGETLFRLSRTYGVKVDQIRKWNTLPDDLIEVGQQLIVGHQ